MRDYATDLKKLFQESYPEESQASPILLQRFLTGLSPPVCHQLLLNGKPGALDQAITDATSIEYALNFQPALEEPTEVNVVHQQPPTSANKDSQKLQSLMEAMTKRLEELEIQQPRSPCNYRPLNQEGGAHQTELVGHAEKWDMYGVSVR